MLLVFDIGNTNIKTALISGNKIMHEWRICTDTKRTGDEYYSILQPLLREAEVPSSNIERAVISSVVPALIGAFVIVVEHLIGKKPIIIGPEIYPSLPIKIPDRVFHEIGTDLLCDALEAWERYKQPVIVVDFGTALSFTAVGPDAHIAGIAIAPGIGTALKALFMNTAQLPSVPLEIPPSSLGKNTITAIQAGIVLGYKGLVESLITQMKADMHKESGISPDSIKVIGTGGFNSMLEPMTCIFDAMDKDITILGIKRAADYYNKR